MRELYRWRDGQDSDTYETIPPDEWMLLPSRLVLRTREELARDPGALPMWRPGFLPFLCDPYGGFMCLDLAGDVSVPGSVLELKPGADVVVIRHDFYELWLETVVAGLEEGLYVSGQLTDEAAWHAMFAYINPSFPAAFIPGSRPCDVRAWPPKPADPPTTKPAAPTEQPVKKMLARPAAKKPATAKKSATKKAATKKPRRA